ncbi:hypothetical protein PAXRUDRAFT_825100 [Paxillus rubicundulus Ve08.2h10]|uniref:Histone deacetylase interacting domain-containing protein n=1 Tax=Paxillus rubicundulus Ve08.2h10 TaxID=930991 RepID=A0A0D0E113_9AGAM|nr:hypothetical protein PAXRUDRAFT_825100 [Paxillus rubicundulus Ve08.2h10]
MDVEQPADTNVPAVSPETAMDIEQEQGLPVTPMTIKLQAPEFRQSDESEAAPTSSPADPSNPEPTTSAASPGGVNPAPESPMSDQPLGIAEEDVAMDVTEAEVRKVEEQPAQTDIMATLPGESATTDDTTSHPDNEATRDVSMPPAQPNADLVFLPPSKPLSPAPTTTELPAQFSTSTQLDLRFSSVAHPEAANERPLNVADALGYLDAVKVQFQDQPDVYNHFLDIMKDFKSQLIDTPGVIRRVSRLFSDHLGLIQGFNTFLPAGYRIECSTDPQQSTMITVTTPSGTVLQSTREDMPGPSGSHWSSFPRLDGPGGSVLGSVPSTSLSPDPSLYGMAMDNASMEPAVQYVQKIKQRCDDATYCRFLEILRRYRDMADAVDEREVSAEIARLFKDDPDLRSDFRVFMPEKSHVLFDDVDEGFLTAPAEARRTRSSTPLDRSSKRKPEASLAAVAEAATIPQKRKRKANEREREMAPRTGPAQRVSLAINGNGTSLDRVASPAFSLLHQQQQQPQYAAPIPVTGLDETRFFDRVKRAINNRDVFNEFLRLVNLFTQELIDTARLVREARNFLGDGDLMRQFREILGWDDGRERERWMLEEQQQQQAWARAQGQSAPNMPLRPGRANTGLQQGSYRRMPPTETQVTCSGRDEMCKSVLNDDWVSHPTWSSEDSGFIAHKKNVYEEALHRSEEERHEYDFHIEAIVRTIGMLEPINNKIAQLNPEERAVYKLKPNLGGSGKSIHQRIIKKIYGREAGLDVLQAMQDTPTVAIPVVLMRLKEKEEEWKRAQREWNKVWREVDARNYQKSLDHQAINYKNIDKKAITARAFVSQIEAARDEQMDKRASYIDPLFARTRPRHQLGYEMVDVGVLQDVIKMTLSLLDRTQGQINVADRKKIETFLRSFVPLFFVLDPEAFNRAFAVTSEIVDGEIVDDGSSTADDAETASTASGSSSRAGGNRKKGGGISSGGDLRKKLLKSEQAKSTIRKTRAQDGPSPAPSRPASPPLLDGISVDGAEEGKIENEGSSQPRPAPRKHVFFCNNIFYVLLRLFEVLYSRLLFFKNLASSMASQAPKSSGVNTVAKDLKMFTIAQLAQLDERADHAEHFYDLMLESCERLFDNEIDQHVFEEQMRFMFGFKDAYRVFTIDKVLGAFIKQVQLVLSDPRSHDLLELLRRDRTLPSPTTQDQMNSRRLAENIMGPDENLYRIDWIQATKTMTIQLLGKDDSRAYDAEILAERWQSYIDSYVSGDSSQGLPVSQVRRPFLRRNLPPSVVEVIPDVIAHGSLEIRVCVRTYRLFYVPYTEDYLSRIPTNAEISTIEQRMHQLKERQAVWAKQAVSGEWFPLQVSESSPHVHLS